MQPRTSSRPALHELAHGLRVGDVLAGHRDHVGLAALDDRVRLGRVVDAPDREDGELPDRRLDAGRERQPQRALVLPVGDVLVGDEVGRALHDEVVERARGDEALRDDLRLGQLDAARAEVVAVDLHADDVVGPDAVADRVDDAQRQPHPPLEVAAVLVLALVHVGREERREQVAAVGRVDLDAVEARGLDVARGEGMALDHLVEVLGLHRLRHLAVERARDRRRGHQRAHGVGAVALAAGVAELGDDRSPVLVDGIGDRAQTGHDRGVVAGDLLHVVGARRMHGREAHDDEPDAAAGAVAVVRDVLLGRQMERRHVGDVRRHHHPVLELQVLEAERREQRVVAHRRASSRTMWSAELPRLSLATTSGLSPSST